MNKHLSIACIRILEFNNNLEKTIQYLAEACFRFTPQVAIRKNEAIFLELTKSLHLFSKTNIELRIHSLSRRLGLKVKITFSQHISLSWTKSNYPQFENEGFSHLPIEACVFFQNPFEINYQATHLIQKLIHTLKTFGISTMEDFLKLPSEVLGSRFGKIAILIHSTARGEIIPVWPKFQPSISIEEIHQLDDDDFEGIEVTLEPLLFSLKNLINRTMIRLIGLGKRASKILIEIKVSPWSTVNQPIRRWEIELPIPQGTSIGIMPIVREHLYYSLTHEPLNAPAKLLRFKILDTVPGHGIQKDFFHQKEIESENWDQLLIRLLSQLGPEHIFYVQLLERYCPEKSWSKKLLSEAHSKNSNLTQPYLRPTRILKTPIPLKLKPSFLFAPSGKLWKVKLWEGPERVYTEWWLDPDTMNIDRDYYKITTYENELLWIFFDRNLYPPQAFLHGFFD